MQEPRRYDDAEVAEIFQIAAADRRAEGKGARGAEGFTLAELQSIGAEVGLQPAQIEGAAVVLDHRRGAVPPRTSLGMPVSAGWTVPLPRAPTDREWEVLLGELRSTFAARGTDRSAGAVRQWTNGNLHAFVEPTEDGYRLRLGTRMGNAAATNRMGLGAIFVGVAMVGAGVLSGELTGALGSALPLLLVGIAALVFNASRLPRWSAEREAQMQRIARRARELLAAAPREDAEPSPALAPA